MGQCGNDASLFSPTERDGVPSPPLFFASSIPTQDKIDVRCPNFFPTAKGDYKLAVDKKNNKRWCSFPLHFSSLAPSQHGTKSMFRILPMATGDLNWQQTGKTINMSIRQNSHCTIDSHDFISNMTQILL